MSQLQVTGEAKIRDIQGPVVANSGVITALDGAASQYVRGDGTLADFPTSTGGGSSVSYYLNSSVSQGTIGGVAYRELSKEPIIGAGTDITISANGYVASYITDANDPDVLSVPGGNFNCEFYFSVNNNTGNPTTYAELYKYDGTTFTLLGSSVAVPESLNQGTTIAPYYFAIPVATAALALTDRLAIRIYVSVDGRVVTLHTENSHLCQVVTTFSKGMVSLNNLTDQSQFITTGTSGTDFNIVSSGDTHTFNIPSASATNRGLITTGNQTIAGNKIFTAGVNVDNLQVVNSTLLNHQAGLSPTLVGTTAIGGSANGLFFNVNDNGRIQEFIFDTTGDRDYTFPAASGTLALTSNLSSYVPYTGATANVDLGVYSLSSRNLTANGNVGSSGSLHLKQNDTINVAGINYGTIATNTLQQFVFYWEDASFAKRFNLDFSALTALGTAKTFTLPDLSGTLALLEGTQTFSGSKTFTQSPISEGGYSFKILASGTLFGNGYSVISSLAGNVSISQAISAGNLKSFTFDFSSWATNTFYTYALPASDGTIALTSNIPANIVTGTGTTNTLPKFTGTSTIGNSNITDTGSLITLSSNVTTTGSQFVQNGFYLTNANAGATAGYTHMWGADDGIFFGLRNATGGAKFVFQSATSYNYTFPAATGTLALTSNLSAYLPLTGGTLTGALTTTDLNVFDTYANDPLIKLASTTSGNVEVQMRTATTTYNAGIGVVTSGYDFNIFTNNSTKMTITSSGNVGIGTSSPNGRLTIDNPAGGNRASLSFDIYENYARIQAYGNGTSSGAIALNPLGNNVGIGTSSPSALLHISGAGTGQMLRIQNTSTVSGDQGPLIQFVSANQVGGQGFESGYIQSIWTGEGNAFGMRFATKVADGGQNERMRITSDGYLRLASKGIQFNGDTSDANSLDDYEEGTWTPTITGSGSNPTINYSAGNTGGIYTKVGNLVTISFEVRWSSLSGGSGAVRIAGLPFTRKATSFPDGDRLIVDSYNNTISGLYIIGNVGNNQNTIGLTIVRSANTTIDLLISDLYTSSIGFLRGTLTYFV